MKRPTEMPAGSESEAEAPAAAAEGGAEVEAAPPLPLLLPPPPPLSPPPPPGLRASQKERMHATAEVPACARSSLRRRRSARLNGGSGGGAAAAAAVVVSVVADGRSIRPPIFWSRGLPAVRALLAHSLLFVVWLWLSKDGKLEGNASEERERERVKNWKNEICLDFFLAGEREQKPNEAKTF